MINDNKDNDNSNSINNSNNRNKDTTRVIEIGEAQDEGPGPGLGPGLGPGAGPSPPPSLAAAWKDWLVNYHARLLSDNRPRADRVREQHMANPKYVLRNWMAVMASEQVGDLIVTPTPFPYVPPTFSLYQPSHTIHPSNRVSIRRRVATTVPYMSCKSSCPTPTACWNW